MYMLTGMIVVLALLAMAAPAAAWPTGYNYDGYSLSTNESGTVDGYVYIDEGNHSGLAASPYVVGYSGIPDGTVQGPPVHRSVGRHRELCWLGEHHRHEFVGDLRSGGRKAGH